MNYHNHISFVDVVEKSSGLQFRAVYSLNRLGNLRYNVNGKFYSDKLFDKTFKIIK